MMKSYSRIPNPSRLFKKHLLIAFMVIGCMACSNLVFGQTLPSASDGGFENATVGFSNNGWSVVATTKTPTWQIGASGTTHGGANSVYGSTTAGSLSGSASATGVSHFYRDIAIPAGATNLQLSFWLKNPTTDPSFDYIQAYITTAANTPATNVVPGTGYTKLYDNGSTLTNATAYNSFTNITYSGTSLPNTLANTTIRLVFTFRHDGAAPFATPIVDDIFINYTLPVAPGCATYTAPTNGATGQTAPVLTWATATGATGYDVYFGIANPPTTVVSTNQAGLTYSPTGLLPSKQYFWYVVPKNSIGSATGCNSTIWSFTTAAIPSCTSNSTPTSNATSVTSGTALSWAASSGATSYDVYWGTANPPSFVSNSTTTSFTPTYTLAAATTYYWYVVPKNTFGSATGCTSSITSYTTAISYCTPVYANGCADDYISNVTLTSGATNLINVNSSCSGTAPSNLTYNATPNPTLIPGGTYGLSVTTDGDAEALSVWIDYNGNGVFDQPGTPSERIIYTQYSGNTPSTYTASFTVPVTATPGQVRMRVRCVYGGTLYGSQRPTDPCTSFKYGETEDYLLTIAAPVAPSCATYSAPANGATGQTSPVLTWAAPTSATSYDVYFGTSNPPTTIVSTGQTGTTYTPSSLTASTPYFWYIVPKNSVGSATGCNSTIWSFTTGSKPSCASNTTPANNAIGISSGAALIWSAASGATSYDVYWGTSNPPTTLVGSPTTTTFTPTYTATAATTYYWYVVPKNGLGSATGCTSTITSYKTTPSYCTPVYSNSSCNILFSDYISAVSLTQGATSLISSTAGCPASGNFTYYTSPNPTLLPGSTYNISVTAKGGEGVSVWIDYNGNGVFETAGTPAEVVINNSYSGNDPATYTTSFTVPLNASAGAVRMRIRAIYQGGTDPCTNYSYGETEDYLVTIGAALPTLTSSLGTLAFGNQCAGITSSYQTFNLTGTSLTPANATVTASVASPYTVSLSPGSGYGSSVSITASGTSIASTPIYVKFTPPALGAYNSNTVSLSGGGATASVALTGTGANVSPTVTDDGVTGITASAASVGGTVTVTGCTAVTAYGVEYSTTSGFGNGTGTGIAGGALAGSSFTSALSGLSSNTTYYYHTYATNSNGTSYSAQGSFLTACGVSNLTYTQNFPTATIPTCWANTVVSGGVISFVNTSGNPSATPSTAGTNMVKFNSNNAASGKQNLLKVIPVNTVGTPNVDVTFDWYNSNAFSTYLDKVTVEYSLDNGGTWTTVTDIYRYAANNGWVNQRIPLPADAGNQPSLTVGLLFTSGNGNNCYLDKFTIEPSCGPSVPVSAMTSIVATSSSKTINWTRGNGSGGVLIIAREAGVVSVMPVSSGTYTANNNYSSGTQLGTGNYVVYNGTGTNFTLTGLSYNLEYYLDFYEYNSAGPCYSTPATLFLATPAGIPITLFDFENNTTRTTYENTVDQDVNAALTPHATLTASSGVTLAGATGDAIAYYGGTASAGTSLKASGFNLFGSDPGTGANKYAQFSINTSGFAGISIYYEITSPDYPFGSADGAIISYDNGNNWSILSAGTTHADLYGSWFPVAVPLSSASDNNPNILVRIYGYGGITNSAIQIDNFSVYATSTTANAGTKVLPNFAQIFTSNTSGMTGHVWSYSDFAVVGPNTTVTLAANDALACSGLTNVTNGGTLNLGPLNAATPSYLIDGTFSVGAGSTIGITSVDGITSSGAVGNVTSTTRLFNTAANYNYAGYAAQTTGTGLPATLITSGNLTIDNSYGVTLTRTTSSPSLILKNGILTTGTANKMTVSTENGLTRSGSTPGWVTGNLEKLINRSGATQTFEVGSNNAASVNKYTPASLTFGTVNTIGYITVSTLGADHPNIATSSIITTKEAKRNWSVKNATVSYANYSALFNFDVTDLVGSPNTANFIGALYNGSAWSYPAVANNTSTSITLSGLTTVGDFQAGETLCTTDTWTGASASSPTDWFDPSNWSCGTVPTSSTNVVIPSGLTSYPLVASVGGIAATTRKISIGTVSAGASGIAASVNVRSTVTLEIYGDLTNSGAPSLGAGIITLKGGISQTIAGTSTFENLEINNTNGVTIASGNNMQKVTGVLTLNKGTLTTNGNLTIASSALGSGLVDNFTGSYNGTIAGNLTVERFVVNPGSAFYYIGSPVSGGTIADWSADFPNSPMNGAVDGSQVHPTSTCSPVALDYGSPYGGLFEYIESSVSTCNLEGWHTRFGGSALNGQGFAARVSNSSTIDMTGSFNNTDIISPDLTRSASNSSPASAGFNLISNPFAAPVDWFAVAAVNAGITGTAYIFQPSTGTYNYVNQIPGGASQIGTSEAFFVYNKSGVPLTNVTFPTTARRNGTNNFLRTSRPYEHLLKLDVTGNGFADKLHIAFGSNFTAGFDNEFDAHKLKNNPGQPNLFATEGASEYAIYAQPSTEQVKQVPVSLETGTAGTFTITASELASFDANTMIVLEDLKLHVKQDLTTNAVYTFTADANDDPARFVVHFTAKSDATVATTVPSSVTITGSTNNVNVNFKNFIEQDEVAMNIYDLTGRKVLVQQQLATGTSTNTFKLNDIVTGYYFVVLTGNGYEKAEKVFLTNDK